FAHPSCCSTLDASVELWPSGTLPHPPRLRRGTFSRKREKVGAPASLSEPVRREGRDVDIVAGAEQQVRDDAPGERAAGEARAREACHVIARQSAALADDGELVSGLVDEGRPGADDARAGALRRHMAADAQIAVEGIAAELRPSGRVEAR